MTRVRAATEGINRPRCAQNWGKIAPMRPEKQFPEDLVRRLPWARAALATVASTLCFFVAARAGAQGCAMCYQNAAASGATGQAALRHGILVLLLPAVSLFTGVLALIYRRREPSG